MYLFIENRNKGNRPEYFSVKNGLKIYIDSSSRSYNTSYNTPRILIADNNFNSSFNINVAEFVYTNAVLSYSEETTALNPDILKTGVTSYDSDCFGIIVVVLICSFMLFNFLRVILRMK